jgi:hypothetical protein
MDKERLGKGGNGNVSRHYVNKKVFAIKEVSDKSFYQKYHGTRIHLPAHPACISTHPFVCVSSGGLTPRTPVRCIIERFGKGHHINKQ